MLKRSLENNGASVSVSDSRDSSAARFGSYDAVVLSGSFSMLSKAGTAKKFRPEIEAVIDSSAPMLGICFGHQLMGHAFGSRVVRGSEPTGKYVKTQVLRDDPLFEAMPKNPSLYESHYEEVASTPVGFRLLATSPTSSVDAIKHERFPLYGVQFHPEKNSRLNPDGDAVIRNFIRMQD